MQQTPITFPFANVGRRKGAASSRVDGAEMWRQLCVPSLVSALHYEPPSQCEEKECDIVNVLAGPPGSVAVAFRNVTVHARLLAYSSHMRLWARRGTGSVLEVACACAPQEL